MSQYTFSGGIHPYDGKELSKDKPVKEVLPKGLLVFPLSQHIGAPAKSVVAVGDQVKVGQLIAEAGGFVSANIFSSVSGTVKAIEPHRVATGGMVQSIVIENDEKYEEECTFHPRSMTSDTNVYQFLHAKCVLRNKSHLLTRCTC